MRLYEIVTSNYKKAGFLGKCPIRSEIVLVNEIYDRYKILYI